MDAIWEKKHWRDVEISMLVRRSVQNFNRALPHRTTYKVASRYILFGSPENYCKLETLACLAPSANACSTSPIALLALGLRRANWPWGQGSLSKPISRHQPMFPISTIEFDGYFELATKEIIVFTISSGGRTKLFSRSMCSRALELFQRGEVLTTLIQICNKEAGNANNAVNISYLRATATILIPARLCKGPIHPTNWRLPASRPNIENWPR
jgi:hypothetical protein